jgi:tripartite-type tricarboxylate transporter receptor subunit TctC
VTDFLAGQVQIYFETAPLILSHAVAGKLRVIAVAGQARIRQLPDVPTTIESGFPKLVGGFWAGVLAPSCTPRGIIDRLNVAINEAMQSPDVQVSLAKLGAEPMLGSPGEFAAFIAAETQKWSAVIKAAGIKID